MGNGYKLKPFSIGHSNLLYQCLFDLRQKIKEKDSKIRGLHYIMPDPVIKKLANFAPLTIDDLSHFDHFNKARLEKYGYQIIAEIRDYLNCNSLESPFCAVPEGQRMSKLDYDKKQKKKKKKKNK